LTYYTGSNAAAGAAHVNTPQFVIQNDGSVVFNTAHSLSTGTAVMAIRSSVPSTSLRDVVSIGPAALTTGVPGRLVVDGGGLEEAVYGTNSGASNSGVVGSNADGIGVNGGSDSGVATLGYSHTGVGVRAITDSGNLVDGQVAQGPAFVTKFH